MSARYEISEGELDVLAITGPEGTRYIDGEEIEARVIRQQSADIAALKDALADEVTANEAFRKAGGARDDEDMPAFCARLIAERDKYRGQLFDCELALKMEHDLLREKRAELAAAVAERDGLTRSIEDDFSGWRAVERRWRSRAEQAEARLAAIDGAPAVAHIANKIGPDYFPCGLTILADRKLPPLGTDLIARPAKD